MCGLAGFVGHGSRDDLASMTSTIAHRGPDAEGFHIDESAGVFLGHRRLSVLDLESGKQPMWNEDNTVAVIFNGEIYNHAELRKTLESSGHIFRSAHSDTEVLVHGYEEWGKAMLLRLNGMFAFAIYDRRKKQVFLARDRFGEKPLYYTHSGSFFAFASEIKALVCHPQFKCAVDERSLQKFFAHGFFPAPNTLYKDTYKLPCGTSLIYDLPSNRISSDCYWRFRLEPDDRMATESEGVLAEEFRHLLERSVKQRMESDVPLGVFLSGGLDSSAVFALAKKAMPRSQISTFTVGFDEKSFDESVFAREVSRAIGSNHHEERLTLATARELAPSILSRLDEPSGDPSILPTYLLSEFTRKHVTVALSGDGGDELFAGYDTVKALMPAQLYKRVVPAVVHKCLRRLAGLLPRSSRNMSLDFKLRRSLTGLTYPEELWNPVWLGPIEPNDFAEVFEKPADAEDVYSEALKLWRTSDTKGLLGKTLEFYTNFYLSDNVLTKVDRASMMASLEVRAPFLDNDVVDFARRLPNDLKYKKGRRKHLVKMAMRDILPDHIIDRQKKGFGIPASAWLREFSTVPPLRPVSGLNSRWVADRWREHRQGYADHRLFLWSWLSMQYLPKNAGMQ